MLHGAEEALADFGARLREARYRASLTQEQLEGMSGVDQSMISRLERAKAPRTALVHIVRLGRALRSDFPLGRCPHAHRCKWRTEWHPPAWESALPPAVRAQFEAERRMARELEAAPEDFLSAADDVGPDMHELRLRAEASGISLVDIRPDAFR